MHLAQDWTGPCCHELHRGRYWEPPGTGRGRHAKGGPPSQPLTRAAWGAALPCTWSAAQWPKSRLRCYEQQASALKHCWHRQQCHAACSPHLSGPPAPKSACQYGNCQDDSMASWPVITLQARCSCRMQTQAQEACASVQGASKSIAWACKAAYAGGAGVHAEAGGQHRHGGTQHRAGMTQLRST